MECEENFLDCGIRETFPVAQEAIPHFFWNHSVICDRCVRYGIPRQGYCEQPPALRRVRLWPHTTIGRTNSPPPSPPAARRCQGSNPSERPDKAGEVGRRDGDGSAGHKWAHGGERSSVNGRNRGWGGGEIYRVTRSATHARPPTGCTIAIIRHSILANKSLPVRTLDIPRWRP